MKVKVYTGPFLNADDLDEEGFIYLEAGATLADFYKKMNIRFPLTRLGLCTVNYKKVKMNTKLKDGDIISFFTPLAGG